MRDYESIYILASTLDEAESERLTTRMQEVVTTNGGEIVKVEKWGKRKLAYEVGKHKKGEYVLLQFQGGPETVAELERIYKMTEPVIKYMTIRLEKEALMQQAAAEARAAEAEAEAEAAAAAGQAETQAEEPSAAEE